MPDREEIFFYETKLKNFYKLIFTPLPISVYRSSE